MTGGPAASPTTAAGPRATRRRAALPRRHRVVRGRLADGPPPAPAGRRLPQHHAARSGSRTGSRRSPTAWRGAGAAAPAFARGRGSASPTRRSTPSELQRRRLRDGRRCCRSSSHPSRSAVRRRRRVVGGAARRAGTRWVFVGRLAPNKRQHLLIAALQRLPPGVRPGRPPRPRRWRDLAGLRGGAARLRRTTLGLGGGGHVHRRGERRGTQRPLRRGRRVRLPLGARRVPGPAARGVAPRVPVVAYDGRGRPRDARRRRRCSCPRGRPRSSPPPWRVSSRDPVARGRAACRRSRPALEELLPERARARLLELADALAGGLADRPRPRRAAPGDAGTPDAGGGDGEGRLRHRALRARPSWAAPSRPAGSWPSTWPPTASRSRSTPRAPLDATTWADDAPAGTTSEAGVTVHRHRSASGASRHFEALQPRRARRPGRQPGRAENAGCGARARCARPRSMRRDGRGRRPCRRHALPVLADGRAGPRRPVGPARAPPRRPRRGADPPAHVRRRVRRRGPGLAFYTDAERRLRRAACSRRWPAAPSWSSGSASTRSTPRRRGPFRELGGDRRPPVPALPRAASTRARGPRCSPGSSPPTNGAAPARWRSSSPARSCTRRPRTPTSSSPAR